MWGGDVEGWGGGDVEGCGGMWQGWYQDERACGRGGSRRWGHVAAVVTCSRGQAYGIDGDK